MINQELKQKIVEFNNQLDSNLENDLDETVQLTLDYLIDNDIVDLSNDDEGDMFETLNNYVYDLIEELNK
jgi:hypothetical protein